MFVQSLFLKKKKQKKKCIAIQIKLHNILKTRFQVVV